MRRFASILVLTVAAITCRAATVTGNLQNIFGVPTSPLCTFTPWPWDQQFQNGQVSVLLTPLNVKPVGGVFAITNMAAGVYRLTAYGVPGQIDIVVPNNTNTYNVGQLATNCYTILYNGNGPTGCVYVAGVGWVNTNTIGGSSTNASLVNGIPGAVGLVGNVLATNGPIFSISADPIGSALAATNGMTNLPVFGFGSNVTERVYSALAFGVTNDCLNLNGAFTTNGSLLVTVTNGNFTAADVGKICKITGAANGYFDLCSGIAAVINATTLQLSNAPGVTAGPRPIQYGHNNWTAVTNGWNFCCTNGFTWLLPPGDYAIAGPILDAGAWTNHHNSMYALPNMPFTMYNFPTFTIKGTGGGDNPAQVVANTTNNNATFTDSHGSTIWCLNYLTNWQAMVSCQNFVTPNFVAAPVATDPCAYFYNSVKVKIEDINFRCPTDNGGILLDLRSASSAGGWNHVGIGVGNGEYYGPSYPTNGGVGVWFPQDYNAGQDDVANLFVEGFWCDVGCGEHNSFYHPILENATIAMGGFDYLPHPLEIINGDFENCLNQLACSNQIVHLECLSLTVENNSGQQSKTTLITNLTPALNFCQIVGGINYNYEGNALPVYNSPNVDVNFWGIQGGNEVVPYHYNRAYTNVVGANVGALNVGNGATITGTTTVIGSLQGSANETLAGALIVGGLIDGTNNALFEGFQKNLSIGASTVSLWDKVPQSANQGASLQFLGQTNNTGSASYRVPFAGIDAGKSNSTAGDQSATLRFWVNTNGAAASPPSVLTEAGYFNSDLSFRALGNVFSLTNNPVEEAVANGLTLGGVRHTSWPTAVTSISGAGDGTLFASGVYGTITASGTLTLPTPQAQNQNTVFAGPQSGAPAAPTFRNLAGADMAPNSSGYLKNNGSGSMTWSALPANLQYLNTQLATNLDANLGGATGSFIPGTLTTSNWFSPTNLLPSTTPDMYLGETFLSVSSATTFGAAAHVTMTNYQTLVINITNTSGSPVQLILDTLAQPKLTGISNAVPWMLTNVGIVTVHVEPGKLTNCVFESLQ